MSKIATHSSPDGVNFFIEQRPLRVRPAIQDAFCGDRGAGWFPQLVNGCVLVDDRGMEAWSGARALAPYLNDDPLVIMT